jgi:hypothetical protein
MGRQLLEAGGIARDVVGVVQALVDQHVHPCQQERHVGARSDRQPVFGLSGRDREAGVDRDDRRLTFQRLDPGLDLAVVKVFPEMGTDQHDTARVLHVRAVG